MLHIGYKGINSLLLRLRHVHVSKPTGHLARLVEEGESIAPPPRGLRRGLEAGRVPAAT